MDGYGRSVTWTTVISYFALSMREYKTIKIPTLIVIVILQRMTQMQIQYVYDEHGRKTAVIVPISMWRKVNIPGTTTSPQGEGVNPDLYRGIYRDLKINIEEEIKKMRAEWDRS
jgi:hypothetical protein